MLKDGKVNGAPAELSPTWFLGEPKESKSDQSTALIILHSPIGQYESFDRLYRHAFYTLCADGGANRLHDMLITQFPELKWSEALRQALPNCIHGDLDSLNDEVRTRYEQLGVEISKDPDQYCPDFAKAMQKISQALPNVRDVLALGSLGGRVDHGVGLLSELYREHKAHPGIRFWLFSESSLSTILQPGTAVIHTPLNTGLITRNIGVLPCYGPATISTQGMEWDIHDWPTEMGGQVSTSNHIVSDRITVTTNNDVLLTIERVINQE